MKINVEKKLRKIVNGHAEGFSIIELIIVIVIAGIMAAVAIPRMGMVTSVDLYSTARQVKSDIRYTQELAMSKYAIRKIVFDGGYDTYAIKDSLDQTIESKELPKRSKATFNAIGSGTTELVYIFNSSGEPDSTYGAGDTLRISSGGSYKDILVEGVTGRATVQ
ncbi:MAG: prepilin-type N-terminal cleavage/methylation domain-containing protein [Candidatus Scalindua sp.]